MGYVCVEVSRSVAIASVVGTPLESIRIQKVDVGQYLSHKERLVTLGVLLKEALPSGNL